MKDSPPDCQIEGISLYKSALRTAIVTWKTPSRYSVYNPETNTKEVRQKMLLLDDLKMLYKKWIDEHGTNKTIPSFSYFASLRPKESVLAGGTGSHTVCVYSQHQNIKLKLKAVDNSLSRREIMTQSVCQTEYKKYMLHECSDCPGEAHIDQYFNTHNLHLLGICQIK